MYGLFLSLLVTDTYRNPDVLRSACETLVDSSM